MSTKSARLPVMTAPRWLGGTEMSAWLGYRRMRLLLDAQIARDLSADSGLSMPDYDVLSALSGSADHRWRLRDLAARMLWSKSRLSRHISRMEERGLVTREGCEDDARGSVVVLTDQGMRAIVTAAPEHVESVRRHFVDLLTPEQLAVLAQVADTVVSHLAEQSSAEQSSAEQSSAEQSSADKDGDRAGGDGGGAGRG